MIPFIFTQYNPAAWYWSVGNAHASTEVYSSAAGEYVPVSNTVYVNWLATGNTATVIDTDVNLNEVLLNAGVTPLFPPVDITPLQFYNRFTPAEQMALSEAAISNAQVHLWVTQATINPVVSLTNAVVIAGVNTLAEIGVITTNRATQILTP